MPVVARERRHEEAHAARRVPLAVALDAVAVRGVRVGADLLRAHLGRLAIVEHARAVHLRGGHLGAQAHPHLHRQRRRHEARVQLARERRRDLRRVGQVVVAAGPAVGDRGEQGRVEAVAQAEGAGLHALLEGARAARRQRVAVRVPLVGLPVGEQHDDPDQVAALAAARRHLVGQVEAGADVGPPFDADAVDAGQHGPAPRPDRASGDHAAGAVREGHEREAIAAIQPLDQRGSGCLRVLDGAALHRAAHVQDQRDREARPRQVRARGRPQRHAQVQRTSGGRQHRALGGRAHRQRSRGWRRQRRRVAIAEVADQVAVDGRDRPARQPRVQLRQRGASGAVGGGVARVRIQAHDRRRRRRRPLRDGGDHRRRAVGLGLGRAVEASGQPSTHSFPDSCNHP